MPEITPTPSVGSWLRIDSAELQGWKPEVGSWLRILPNLDGTDLGVGSWLRIDSVSFGQRPSVWGVDTLTF
jgi:hypothetical protein